MKIIQEGHVARADDQEIGTSLAFPGICVLPEGRWICTFRSAPKKTPLEGQDVCVTWSDDSGCSWSKPSRPFAPIRLGSRKGTFRTGYLTPMSDGSVLAVLTWVEDMVSGLPYFNEETEGLLDSQIFLARSRDRGATWSAPEAAVIRGFSIPIPYMPGNPWTAGGTGRRSGIRKCRASRLPRCSSKATGFAWFMSIAQPPR